MLSPKLDKLKAAVNLIGDESIFTGDLSVVAAGYSKSNPTLAGNLREMAARYRGLVESFKSNEPATIVASASALLASLDKVDKRAFDDSVMADHKAAIGALRHELGKCAPAQQTARGR